MRRRRVLYATTTGLLSLVVGIAVIDGLGAIDAVGVDSTVVEADGAGYHLAVQHGTVTRPALATPLEITVTRPGGFDGPVMIAVDREYLEMWDLNGLLPEPSASTGDADRVLWEFDPPEGDVLAVSIDARIEPAVQDGRSGWVAVLVDARPVVRVGFETRVLP